jgi:hypothetical protein
MELHLHNSDCIVVKDSWDIFRGELVRCVTDEETSLSHCTIADDDAPMPSVSVMSSSLSTYTALLRPPVLGWEECRVFLAWLARSVSLWVLDCSAQYSIALSLTSFLDPGLDTSRKRSNA